MSNKNKELRNEIVAMLKKIILFRTGKTSLEGNLITMFI